MKCKKNHMIFSKMLLLIVFSTFGQSPDTININTIKRLSLQEMLETPVEVSVVRSQDFLSLPSTVTIINTEQIQQYVHLSLAELISTISGIEVYQSIIDRNITTSRGILQNFYANKILLLINNVPTWQPIYGNGMLDRISVNQVERIEVLKGPASVLYGSNAFSGVVNIVLKNVGNETIKGVVRSGWPNYQEVGLNASVVTKKIHAHISANSMLNKSLPYDFNAAAGYFYNGDSVFSYKPETYNNNFNLICEYKNHKVLFNIAQFDHSYPGAQPSYAGGGGNMVENTGLLFNYRYQRYVGNTEMIGNVYYDGYNRQFPLSADRINLVKLAGERIGANLSTVVLLTTRLNLETGIAMESRISKGHDTYDGMKDTVVRNNLLNDNVIYEGSGFVQLHYQIGSVKALIGSRYTYNNLFGSNLSSRLSVVKEIDKRNVLKLIYGESFRAPSMFELYFNHPTVVGNVDLKPETLSSVEFAYLTHFSTFYVQSLCFFNKVTNLIQRYTDTQGPPSEYRNIGETKGWGIEVEAKYSLDRFNWNVNYTFLKGMDKKSEELNYRFVPDHSIDMGLVQYFNRFYTSINGKFISSVKGHIADIEPQYFLNVNVGYEQKLNQYSLRHVFSVKNIFNNSYNIPEYIRLNANINEIPTLKKGRLFLYSLYIDL